MVRGAFREFVHGHFFEEASGGTRMVDLLRFSAPLGVVGWVVERAVLGRYMRRFLEERARVLKDLAEGGGWRAFVGG
jgi:hypothetical protein